MKRNRVGNTLLAAVLAFALALPAPALAFAAEGAGLQAGSAGALQAATADLQPADATALDVNADIWDGAIDTTWYNTTATTFTLTKPSQLAGLAAIVNGTATGIARDTFRGKTVRLGADIALNATSVDSIDDSLRNWVPIGYIPLASVDENGSEGPMPHYTDGIFFDGTFDGAGHVVRNIYIHDSTPGSYGGVQALFGNVGGHATIQNLGLEGGFVYGRVAAGLVAISHSTSPDSIPHIIGCYNTATIECNGSSTRGAGGIFGGEEQWRDASTEEGVAYEANYHGAAYIANCYNAGRIFEAATANCSIGGIAGTGSVQMYGCYNRGRVDALGSMYGGALGGNLIGDNYLSGQNRAGHPQYPASAVADSCALSGSIGANEDSKVVLYNLVDADHDKGGKAERSPAVTDADTVKFKAEAWFATTEAENALSQSFDIAEGGAWPILYWQQHRTQWNLEEEDAYGYPVYELWGYRNPYSYTGSPITPPVTVTYEDGGVEGGLVYLHAGSDFTVEYSNNVEIGTAARVTVTGIGRFYGTQSTTFTIRDGNLKDAVIEPILAQWWYGSAVEPDIVVRTSDEVLQPSEYNVEFSGNNPTDWSADGKATATVTVTPKDATKLSGQATASFTILKASTGLQGTGDETDPYRINNKGDLQYLAWATSGDGGDELVGKFSSADAHFLVTADIDATSSDDTYMTDRPCDPLFTTWGKYVDSNTRDFCYGLGGTIDGRDATTGKAHTITLGQTETGVSLDLAAALGLVVYTHGGTSPAIKNLVVDGSVSCPHGAAAGFLVMGESGNITFEDCVNKATVHGDAFYAGGAAGFIVQTSTAAGSTLTMKNCVNEGAITSSAGRAGGFISALGGLGGSLSANPATYANTFTDCVNKGVVTGGGENGAGGFVAVVLGEDSSGGTLGRTTLFERCGNEASGTVAMTSSGDVGGIIGQSQNAVQLLKFDRCYNKAALTGAGSGSNGGGIVGRAYNTAELTNCYNTGDVRMRGSYANNGAGLVGYFGSGYNDSTSLLLKNVYATGAFTGPDADSGGLVGNLFLHTTITLDNAYYDSASAGKWYAYNPADKFESAIDPPVINGQATAYDTEAMKSVTFATLLGGAFAADAADETTGAYANKGFPVLTATEVQTHDIADTTAVTAKVKSGDDPWQYTGAPIRPTIEVSAGGDDLQEGRDFVVFYTASGTKGKATVQGIGTWYGSRSLEFAITPCNLSSCSLSQVGAVNFADIAGGEATQDIVVTNPYGAVMKEGVDYELTYSQNDEPGFAYMRVEGLSPYYTGSLLRMFTIAKGDLGDTARVALSNVQAHYPLTYGSAGLYIYEQLTASSGYTLKRADLAGLNYDYVRYFLDSEGNEVTVSTSLGTARASSITKAGEYTVVLSANDADVVDRNSARWTNSHWTGKVTAKFTYGNRIAEDAAISGVGTTYGYTGKAIAVKPALMNKLTGYPMTEGAEYKLTYLDSNGNEVASVVDTGRYTLVVSANDNSWFGEARFPFTVVPGEYYINDDTVVEGIASSYLTTGSAVSPAPTAVKIGGKQLSASDYAVTYEDANGKAIAAPTAAGTYYAVITGTGAYTGSKKVPFSLENPFISVYVKQGASGTATLAKAFSRAEFVALKSSGDPVSALYCEQGGSNWHVATAKEYVTLPDLLKAAGVSWGAGVRIQYGGDASQGKSATTFTYEQEQQLRFFPATTATSTDNFGGTRAPFVFSITDASCPIGQAGTVTAQEAQELNLRNASSGNAPRAIMGVLESDYIDARANAAAMMGVRLWNKTSEVVVTLPAAEPDPTPTPTPDPTPTPAPTVEAQSMYRLYNPNSGEHFYTATAAERNNLVSVGWTYEGIAWKAPKTSNTPVYRLYNPNAGDHHYTTSVAERNNLVSVGWRYEGIGWYSDDNKTTPLYRLYNPNAIAGAHHYTTSAAERDNLVSVGWSNEGIGWYGAK